MRRLTSGGDILGHYWPAGRSQGFIKQQMVATHGIA